MSVEQVESAILALAPEERQRLARWFDEHRDKLEGAGDFVISDEASREIERRSSELETNPGLAQPIDDEYFARMKRRVADALSGKAPPRCL